MFFYFAEKIISVLIEQRIVTKFRTKSEKTATETCLLLKKKYMGMNVYRVPGFLGSLGVSKMPEKTMKMMSVRSPHKK